MCKIRASALSPLRRFFGLLFASLLLVLAFAPSAYAQTAPGPSQPLITQSIDEGNLVVLAGNTRPEANAANDQGIVSDSLPLEHMMLQLRRPAAQEQALETLIDQLHDRKSPNFHHWVGASELGAQFGLASSDIQTITGWLQQRGFAVNLVYPNGMVIDFSGTAGQIRTAFHTEIHNLSVNGVAHIANMSDPQIPAALAPAVVGIVSLHDFMPHPLVVHNHVAAQLTGGPPLGYYVTPADLATIYNFNPLFNAGLSGQNQTIYLIEDTDLYTNNDWTTFRSTFGLSGYTGASLLTTHPAPSGPNNCFDPGTNSDEDEAILDAEYASAAAPSAAIVMVTCKNTETTPGLLIAIQNSVNLNPPPAIMSISYGGCEASSGASLNSMVNTAYQTGVAEGMSIFVAAGDWGAAECDKSGETPTTQVVATHGVSVSGLASTIYNVAVGGTDFADTYTQTNSTYWNSTNTATYGSAISYIPEIPWNSSCGSQLLATYLDFSTTYGSSGFCNSSFAANPGLFHTDLAGGGGPSLCATGVAQTPGVVSGSCLGWPKPSWQSGVFGIANDGVRDLPDVSLFASVGLPWYHTYIYCWSDPNYFMQQGGAAPCTGAPSNWSDGGGTSFAAPIWAGIQALINQQSPGGRQGNPNYRLYQLAAGEYGASGSIACNSTNANGVGASCIFHDVTIGDNDVPCTVYYNCYDPSGTYGVLASPGVLSSSPIIFYPASTGWDFATGIGTPNVTVLVANWGGGCLAPGVHCFSAWGTHSFSGDGKSDILWLDTTHDVGMWLMNGSTILKGVVFNSVPAQWSVVGQRDFNGDGFADILWRDTVGNVGMWLMNGSQILLSTVLGIVPTIWSVVGTGDFNGDGRGDILWRDNLGNVGIWLMNGTQILQAQTVGNVPTNWVIVGSDMKGDIFWRDTATGDVGMWVMNGFHIVQSVNFGAVSLNWQVVGIGDFDSNGSEDILWRDNLGNVAIWLLAGTQILSTMTVTPPDGWVPTSWTPVETGDYNGDARSDILFADTSGDAAIWFMNGTQILSTAKYTNVGTFWMVQGQNAD
jgi:Pro-kumamolisin, activation domain/FG-GAP-like repeat